MSGARCESLCQDCLAVNVAHPDNLGTCMNCGGETCSCGDCLATLALLRRGVRAVDRTHAQLLHVQGLSVERVGRGECMSGAPVVVQAPTLRLEQYQRRTCPLLSTIDDGKLNRVACIAPDCALWVEIVHGGPPLGRCALPEKKALLP